MYAYTKTRRKQWPRPENLSVVVLLLFLSCQSTRKMSFDKQGHRGCRGLMPENTIPAMIKAIDLGVTTLEMDISISKDKKPVVSHDPWFAGLISTAPDGSFISVPDEKKYTLYGMNYDEIRKWDVGLKPHPIYPNQQKMPAYKPLLEELLDSTERYARLKGVSPLFYNIETKISPSGDEKFHPGPEEFVDLVMQVVNRKNLAKRTIIQSFDERTLRVMHRKYPKVKTAYLIEGTEKNTVAENIVKLGFTPAIYSPEYKLVTTELISYCHEKGMKVIPWTVNDSDQIKKLKEMGVDGVITDYPNLFNR